jgi:hypothetical protein
VIEILLDVAESGYYHIMAQTNEATPLLQCGKQFDEMVRAQVPQCYKYYVKEEDTGL